MTADCDGDGVTNEEEVDPDGDGTPGPNGTDPTNPCDYDTASQDFSVVSAGWLAGDCDGDGTDNGIDTEPFDPCIDNGIIGDEDLSNSLYSNADCDGDGVPNGDEVDPDGDGTPGPNGTDPANPCDFTTINQDLSSVSTGWLLLDCDGDGVSNGDEVDPDSDGTPGPNGTNPTDPCDYTSADQDLAIVDAVWLLLDCDGDGTDNGIDIEPLNPCVDNGTIGDEDLTNPIFADADCDGDGVTNGDEVDPDGDGTPGPNGTNPSDPCDYNSVDQLFASVDNAWLAADCDGDGVTNGDEVDPDGDGTTGPNGTDPTDPCNYNSADQVLASVNTTWLLLDCDGDGVTNGDEVDPDGDGTAGPNGTNPTDPCDYIAVDQNVSIVDSVWLALDCDNDGLTNGEEVTNGSDPLNPCSPKSCDEFDIPEAFSPDGDGVNETFIIKGVENFSGNTLIIFNRWGNEVFNVTEYDNSWSGISTSNLNIGGDQLPTGTYYYIFDTKTEKYGVLKGYVYLKR